MRTLEQSLKQLCRDTGFPPGEEFKWSPGRDLWMRDNLTGSAREQFFTDVLGLAQNSAVTAIVVVEDKDYQTAAGASTHEEDTTCLFLERIHKLLSAKRTEGIVIVDRPGGGRSDEDRFLGSCLETLQTGTNYVYPDRIALSVLSAPSNLIRLLQLADLITSCTLAVVAGEDRYSPPVFASIRHLLYTDRFRIGGYGLKIHPDGRYANLYHWLLGDAWFIRGMTGDSLPLQTRPYSTDPRCP